MRTINIRNTQIDILANRQDRIVVIARGVVRNVMLALPISGHFSQVLAGFMKALKRAMKPAAAAVASAAESIGYLIGTAVQTAGRCWHVTHSVTPHLAVVSVGS